MKILRIIVFFMIAIVLLGGCKKKRSKNDGTYYGVEDTPLASFPLDSFYEPTGTDSLVLRDIHFDYDSYAIKVSEMEILSGIIGWLRDHPGTHLLVEGHCDERGSNEYNLALGEQRALAVRQYIIDQGIQSQRIQTISYGEERPIDPGSNEAAWSQNRRAHFLIANG